MTSRFRHIGNARLDQTLSLFSFAFCPKVQREQAAVFQPKNRHSCLNSTLTSHRQSQTCSKLGLLAQGRRNQQRNDRYVQLCSQKWEGIKVCLLKAVWPFCPLIYLTWTVSNTDKWLLLLQHAYSLHSAVTKKANPSFPIKDNASRTKWWQNCALKWDIPLVHQENLSKERQAFIFINNFAFE